MKSESRFNPLARHEQASHEKSQGQAGHEFMSVEDLLRHDATQTPVPPHLAGRLRESLAREPQAKAGWWRRLLQGGK